MTRPTDAERLSIMLRAASYDERLHDGMLCRKAADLIDSLISASAATVECPECGVRFDPTWKRPTMPQQPAVVVAPTVSLTNEQTGYGYANGANAPISETGRSTVAPNVDGQDFYELCQAYRHSKEIMPLNLPNTVQAFSDLREYIKTGKLPWPSYESHTGNEEPDSKVKRIESAYCAANDYINALLNPSVPPESLAEIAADYWKKVRAV